MKTWRLVMIIQGAWLRHQTRMQMPPLLPVTLRVFVRGKGVDGNA